MSSSIDFDKQILFTASAYPNSLAASSVRGIVTTLALIFFSASVGKWVDLSPCRLHTLLVTIFVNRLCVILACLCWFLIVDVAVPGEQPRSGLAHGIRPRLPLPALAAWWPQARSTIPLHATAKESFFILALLVGVPEKLSGVANMLSMERDWVPTLSSAVADTMPTYDLTHLNAVMRRIDLTCKLIAPIVISFVVSVTGSTRTGVLFSIAMSLVSCPVEWWCARQAWDRIPQLQNQNPIDLHHPASDMPASHNRLQRQFYSVSIAARSWLQDQWGSWQEYFHASVWIPSFALSILHLSVLSYSATFITYLLSTGEFSLTTITIARAISSLIEVSSTLVMPWGVRYLSRRQRQGWQLLPAEEEESGFAQDAHTSETSVGLQRLGLWGLWGQFLSLVPVVLALWHLPRGMVPPSLLTFHPTFTTKFSLFFFLCLSRLGLWTFDLTAQQLAQTRITPDGRSSFAGVETSLVGVFELGHWMAALIAGGHAERFRWLALGSLGAVGASMSMYMFWLRRERGHLVHWPPYGKREWVRMVSVS